MKVLDQIKFEVARFRILFGFMLAGLVYLSFQLWQIQVAQADQYQSKLDRQSVRRVRMAATRGRIVDRNHKVLVDTVPGFCIAAYVEELRQPGKWSNTVEHVDAVLNDVSRQIKIPNTLSSADIWKHVKKRLPLPLVVWRDVGSDVVARWMEGVGSDYPGVDIYVEPKRVYPYGPLAAHVLGYVGRAHPEQDSEETFHFYYPEMEGQSGLERSMNDALEGQSGGRLLRVNASGIMHDVIGEKKPIPGMDVVLAMDVRVQQVVEAGLKNYIGACVVMDPNNGEILAMASAPSFDPNFFAGERSAAGWDALRLNPDRPMINRAISSAYPPGSTFKPVVALAALQSHKVSPLETFLCNGSYKLGGTEFHCWSREHGHGTLAMVKAFEQSCNPYFIQLGLRCGYETIHLEAERLGFGARTGIPLGAEAAGWLPPITVPWRLGDTCNLSIGQGDLLATPVQMVTYVSAIANGGILLSPRLLLSQGRDAFTHGPIDLYWDKTALATVRRGMFEVVQSETGTGKRARLAHELMAGKTGTAEYGTRQNHKKYAWMIAYAPYEHPRYAIAVVLENTTAGGVNAAPIVKSVMTGALSLKDTESFILPFGGAGT
jgi:penicillin-binding protein 2